MLTLLFALFVITAGAGISLAVVRSQSLYWFMLAPFFSLVVFIAPYKLWKQNENELKGLKCKRLTIDVEQIDDSDDKKQPIWNHLIVRNLTAQAITGCYGRPISFRAKQNIHQKFPASSIHYPWTTNIGGLGGSSVDIGARSHEYLDVFYIDFIKSQFFTPLLQRDNWTRFPSYPLSEDEYDIKIEVGSSKEDIAHTTVHLKVIFHGDKFIVEKLGECTCYEE